MMRRGSIEPFHEGRVRHFSAKWHGLWPACLVSGTMVVVLVDFIARLSSSPSGIGPGRQRRQSETT